MPESPLSVLCTPGNFIRNTMVSDTFRAPIIMNGDYPSTYDIERIQVPFNPVREAYIREKFSLTQRELDEYYRNFSQSLRNGLSIASRLHSDPNAAKGASSIASFVHQSVAKHDSGEGYDVYLVSHPMTRYLDSAFCQGGNISFRTAVNLMTRLLISVHNLHTAGIYLGALDVNSLCLMKAPTDVSAKEFIAFTSLLYARSSADKIIFPYTKVLPPYAHPSLAEGAQPDENTDNYAVAALLASIFNGTVGSDHPSFELIGDAVPDTLMAAIRDALTGTINARDFAAVFRDLKKKSPFWRDEASAVLMFPVIRSQPDLLMTQKAVSADEQDENHVFNQPPASAQPDTVQPMALEELPGSFVLEDNFAESFFPEELRRPSAQTEEDQVSKPIPAPAFNFDDDDDSVLILE